MASAAAYLEPALDGGDDRISCAPRARTRIERVDARGMAAHRDAWMDLSARALEPNVFLEPAFVLALSDALGEDRKPQFLLAWNVDAGPRARLLALLPLHGMRRRGVLVARGFRHDLITLGTPLVDQQRGLAAFEDMLGWLAAMPAAPCAIVLVDVPADGPFWTAVGNAGRHATRELASRERAVLSAGGSAGASKKRLKEFARQRRRLAERGRLTFASATSTEAVAEGIERFFELEASGWKGRRGSALACDPQRTSFARAMTRGMADRDACRIDSLLLDDAPIAMGIVLRGGAHAAFWKTAFDENFGFASPGAQLALELTRVQERDPSLALTDSCAIPGHPMIDGLWSGRRRMVDALIATSPAIGPRRFALATRIELSRRGLRAFAKRALGAGRRTLRDVTAFVPSRRPGQVVPSGWRRRHETDGKGKRP